MNPQEQPIKTFRITEDWIRAHATYKGVGWNRRQLSALGVAWPAKAGWLKGMIGRAIAPASAAMFERLRASNAARQAGADKRAAKAKSGAGYVAAETPFEHARRMQRR